MFNGVGSQGNTMFLGNSQQQISHQPPYQQQQQQNQQNGQYQQHQHQQYQSQNAPLIQPGTTTNNHQIQQTLHQQHQQHQQHFQQNYQPQKSPTYQQPQPPPPPPPPQPQQQQQQMFQPQQQQQQQVYQQQQQQQQQQPYYQQQQQQSQQGTQSSGNLQHLQRERLRQILHEKKVKHQQDEINRQNELKRKLELQRLENQRQEQLKQREEQEVKRQQQMQSQPPVPSTIHEVSNLCLPLISISKDDPLFNCNTASYKCALKRLSYAERLLLTNIYCFTFITRSLTQSTATTPDARLATFFMSNLSRVNPQILANLGNVVGIRCICCRNAPKYIPGATSFAELSVSEPHRAVARCIKNVHSHILSCTYANGAVRQVLQTIPKDAESSDFLSFVNIWTSMIYPVVCGKPRRNSTRTAAPPPPPPLQPPIRVNGPNVTTTKESGAITQVTNTKANNQNPAQANTQATNTPTQIAPRQSLVDRDEKLEEVLFYDLMRSFTKAKLSTNYNEYVVSEDLTMLPFVENVIETPIVELWMQCFELVTLPPDAKDGGKLCIRCSFCNGKNAGDSYVEQGKWCFSPTSKTVDEVASTIARLGMNHFRICDATPKWTRKRLITAEESARKVGIHQPIQQLTLLVKSWMSLLKLASRICPKDYEPKLDAEIWVPEMALPHSANIEHPTIVHPKPEFTFTDSELLIDGPLTDNDVVVNEFVQSLRGNRRYRNLVSQHRSLYKDVSEAQQETLCKFLIDRIKRNGGKIQRLVPQTGDDDNDKQGYKLEELTMDDAIEYIANDFEHGFARLFRPAVAHKLKHPGCYVYDLESGPMVGLLHGGKRPAKALGCGKRKR